jgi:hypothetical protein
MKKNKCTYEEAHRETSKLYDWYKEKFEVNQTTNGAGRQSGCHNGEFDNPFLEYAIYVLKKEQKNLNPRTYEGWREARTRWQSNCAQGKAFEIEQVAIFKKIADDVEEQITIRTSDGTKIRVDAIGYDYSTNPPTIVIQEYKSSDTAPMTPNQTIGIPQLFQGGGIIVGKGKGVFRRGVVIPKGTEVEIVRP